MIESERFDDELLAAYAECFYGYGRYDGDYWFIGMEEGGGDSFDEINAKLINWDRRGRRELEDLAEYHDAIGVVQWFRPKARIQPTWGKYVRIILGADGRTPTSDHVREYQADRLGQTHGNSCLMELLPLPCPSLGHWHYAERSRLRELCDRERYMAYYAPRRAAHICEKIHEYKPRAVVFSGIDSRYLYWWKQIAQVDVEPRLIAERRCLMGSNGSTLFIVTSHPVAMGITNDYFHQIGRLVGEGSRLG